MGLDDYEFESLDDINDEDFLRDDYDGELDPEFGPEPDNRLLTRARLSKARTAPERRTLESMDRENSICIHELARAMEEFATKEPVQLYGGSVEFEEAARAVLGLAHKHRCGLKGR